MRYPASPAPAGSRPSALTAPPPSAMSSATFHGNRSLGNRTSIVPSGTQPTAHRVTTYGVLAPIEGRNVEPTAIFGDAGPRRVVDERDHPGRAGESSGAADGGVHALAAQFDGRPEVELPPKDETEVERPTDIARTADAVVVPVHAAVEVLR